MKFVDVEPATETEETTLILGFTKDELMRIAEGLGVAIVAILVILLVIRPLINNAFENGPGPKLLGENDEENLLLSNFLNEENAASEDLVNINKVDGRIKVSSIKRLNEIIDKNPDAAANVIRGWLYQNDNQ